MRQPRAIFLGAIFGYIANNAVLAATPAQQSKCEIASNRYWATHDPERVFDTGKIDPIIFKFPPINPGKIPPPDPVKSFFDDESKITFSIEKDGRHITATDGTGKVLWRRNPFVDYGLCPYRSPHLYIQWVGPPGSRGPGWHLDALSKARPESMINSQIVRQYSKENPYHPQPTPRNGDRFIGLAFNSSQFGYLSIRTGEFYFGGQN